MNSVSVASRKLALLAGFIVPLKMLACSCAPPPPPCEAIDWSPLVFLGTVTAVTERTPSEFKTAQMRIDRSFRGSLKGSVELFDDGMCDGPELLAGHQYLMYTSRFRNGAISARGCNRSRAAEYAQEDLEFLEAYAAGKTSTRVYGVVQLRPDQDRREEDRLPLKDVQIALSGKGQQLRATTASDGSFSFRNISAGQYQVRSTLKGYRQDSTMRPFSVSPKACYQADMLMKVERVVQGMVRDSNGKPVTGVRVEMISANTALQRWQRPYFSDISDKNGRYSIAGFSADKYLLGVNIQSMPTKEFPFSPRYYPDTADARLALPLNFLAETSIQSFDLRVPDRLPLIKVKGRIQKADGTLPRREDHVDVYIEGPRLEGQIAHQEIKDADGRFEFELLEGITYSAFAFYGPFGSRTYSAPLEFIATKDHDQLLFVLDKTSKEFQALMPK